MTFDLIDFFENIDSSQVGSYAEKIVFWAFFIIILLFAIQLIQQVRLLNRFLKTPLAKVWSLASILLLVSLLLLGIGYVIL